MYTTTLLCMYGTTEWVHTHSGDWWWRAGTDAGLLSARLSGRRAIPYGAVTTLYVQYSTALYRTLLLLHSCMARAEIEPAGLRSPIVGRAARSVAVRYPRVRCCCAVLVLVQRLCGRIQCGNVLARRKESARIPSQDMVCHVDHVTHGRSRSRSRERVSGIGDV